MTKPSFAGGIHPPYQKEATAGQAVASLPDAAEIVMPLQQCIGAPPQPLVEVGQEVRIGEKIGDSEAFVTAPVHASVSGKVVAIEQRLGAVGTQLLSAIISSDGRRELAPEIQPPPPLSEISVADLRQHIRQAGLVGMGGAMFPTHVKVSPPEGKSFDVLIINGAECEPFLTCDHRVMLEMTEHLLLGIRALQKVTGVEKTLVGIEENKPDALEHVSAAARELPGVEIRALEVKYPQGAEKQLINSLTGREVPSQGLPVDVGCLVQNVGTTAALGRYLATGMPLVERVVTVTGGSIERPGNYLVPLGTPFAHLLEHCGVQGEPARLIAGGPMMGVAQPTAQVPVVKGTSGLLLQDRKEAVQLRERPCVRCGRCPDSCPIGLLPLVLMDYSVKSMWDQAERYHILDCIECGCCSYVCPTRRSLVQSIRLGKAEILQRRQKQNSKG